MVTANDDLTQKAIPSDDRAWELFEWAYTVGAMSVLGWADDMVLQSAGKPTNFTVYPSPVRSHEDEVLIIAVPVPHPDLRNLGEVVLDGCPLPEAI